MKTVRFRNAGPAGVELGSVTVREASDSTRKVVQFEASSLNGIWLNHEQVRRLADLLNEFLDEVPPNGPLLIEEL